MGQGSSTYGWEVNAGPCVINGACVTSPSYPAWYPPSVNCFITLPAGTVVSATFFRTSPEDMLIFNNGGGTYSGSDAPLLVASSGAGITWQATALEACCCAARGAGSLVKSCVANFI